MRYPEQNCPECGHRLFAHVEGGVFCPECGYYFDSDDDDNGDRVNCAKESNGAELTSSNE